MHHFLVYLFEIDVLHYNKSKLKYLEFFQILSLGADEVYPLALLFPSYIYALELVPI